MTAGRSCTFTHALCRKPAQSITDGLRATDRGDPDPARFAHQHEAYVAALRETGATVTVLDALEAFPDSVFIEDAALCLAGVAIVLRPGAPSRLGEAEALRPALAEIFDDVLDLPGQGHVDGGDVLAGDEEVFIGLSARTDPAGFEALSGVVRDLGYRPRLVSTPPEILHFKTDCGLLDPETVFSTSKLAETGCFDGLRVLEAPEGEEAAANLVRFNDVVLLSAGFPRTADLLDGEGYELVLLDTGEAARVDGGLSCMSLRFSL